MANEYRLYTGLGEALLAKADRVRLYSGDVEALIRAPQVASSPKLYSGQADVVLQSNRQVSAPKLYLANAPILISTALVMRPTGDLTQLPMFAPSYEPEANPTPVPVALSTAIESNPYRPDVPIHLSGDDPDLYEYLREQAELLRQQHNLTQAGDSTYPWEIATTPSQTAEFTLGSMSRFVHDSYGVLSARFVQFSADTVQPSLWMGFDKGSVEWVATNKAKRTGLWRPLGLNLAAGEVAGMYGWVLTHGRGPVAILVESEAGTTLVEGQSLTWDPASPDSLVVGPGPEIARILDPSQGQPTSGPAGKQRHIFPAGSWVLGLNGGVTPEYIDQRAAAGLVEIEAAIAAIQVSLEALESQDYATVLASLQAQQDLFAEKLTAESKARNLTDGNLNRKIELLRESLGQLQNSFGAGTDLSPVYTAISNLEGVVSRNRVDETARLAALEAWRGEAENKIAGLLAAADANQRPVMWAMQVAGTGASQMILLPSNGLLVTDVLVYINGLKWQTTEYTIVDQNLTITSNAAGDKIEIIGF